MLFPSAFDKLNRNSIAKKMCLCFWKALKKFSHHSQLFLRKLNCFTFISKGFGYCVLNWLMNEPFGMKDRRINKNLCNSPFYSFLTENGICVCLLTRWYSSDWWIRSFKSMRKSCLSDVWKLTGTYCTTYVQWHWTNVHRPFWSTEYALYSVLF